MIGYVRKLIEDRVLVPQSTVTDKERRAYLDRSETPLDVQAQELDTMGLRSTPISSDLAGGVTVRHSISVAVVVTHGDPVEAIRLRDAIVLDLVLRLRDADLTAAAPDVATGQYVTGASWDVDYLAFALDDTRETATLTFTVDTELDG